MSNSTETAEVELIWKVVPCALLIVGTIGSVLSLIVLCRKSMRTSRLTRYLICLSVADLLVIYTGLLPLCIFYIGGVYITNTSLFLCKVLPWMLYFSLDMSAWIMVSATLERSISVWIPHRVKLICTKKMTIVSLVIICVILLLVNGHFLIGYDLRHFEEEGMVCFTRNNSDYEIFEEKTFPWIDLFLFSIGPFVCQLVGNTVIVVGLVRHYKTLAKYSIDRRGQSGKKEKLVSSMTIMLLVLNVMYLVFTLPISVFYLEKALWDPELTKQRRLFYDVANLLYYVNNSTNFIAYMISGRRFRSELWSMIRGSKLKTTTTMIFSRASLANSRNLGNSARLSSSQNLGSSVNGVYSVSENVLQQCHKNFE